MRSQNRFAILDILDNEMEDAAPVKNYKPPHCLLEATINTYIIHIIPTCRLGS